jgi:hypothetical protein
MLRFLVPLVSLLAFLLTSSSIPLKARGGWDPLGLTQEPPPPSSATETGGG